MLSVESTKLMGILQKSYSDGAATNIRNGTGAPIDERIANSANSQALQTVNSFNETTQKEIVVALRAAAEANSQMEDDEDASVKLILAVGAVRAVFRKLRERRRSLIIESGVLSAYNSGVFDSANQKARQDNTTLYKTWRSLSDGKVRESHRDLNGQKVPVQLPFSVDGQSIRFPRDPLSPPSLTINCRCFLTIGT